MNKSICLAAMALFIFATGCQQQNFKKDEHGTEYKIIANSAGKQAAKGDIMQVNLTIKYKDSLIFSSTESSRPRFLPYDTAHLPPYFNIIHEGDSLVIRQLTDSLMKYGTGAPFMKKGNYIVRSFKIVKLYPTEEAADSARRSFVAAAMVINKKKIDEKIQQDITNNDSLVKADEQLIKDYMSKHNLTGTKTAWGTYVIIDEPGSGPLISDTNVAVVNYTGRTLDDSTFDSNTLSEFGHVKPLFVDMSTYEVIPGWIDGLKMMHKGTKGKIIIPSYLAWGENGAPPKIAPNANVVFDIEVTDVVGQKEHQQEIEKEQQEKMEQLRKLREMRQQQQQNPSASPQGK